MSLAETLAHVSAREIDRNEAALAKCFPPAPHDLTDDSKVLGFIRFCEERGVRFAPARVETVASFIVWQRDLGVPIERTVEVLTGIERLHDAGQLANPVQTRLVRSLLVGTDEIKPPRSWRKEEQQMFATLPEPIKAVIARRENERETVLRRTQNEAAALRKSVATTTSTTMSSAFERAQQSKEECNV
jgi:hypothetical protein